MLRVYDRALVRDAVGSHWNDVVGCLKAVDRLEVDRCPCRTRSLAAVEDSKGGPVLTRLFVSLKKAECRIETGTATGSSGTRLNFRQPGSAVCFAIIARLAFDV